MSNSFADAGPCKEARSGRHAWLDVTTEADEPQKHYRELGPDPAFKGAESIELPSRFYL